MGILGDKRKERYAKRCEAKLNAKEARSQYRQEMRNRLNKFADGGVVYPVRFKYNRRVLLLTRLR